VQPIKIPRYLDVNQVLLWRWTADELVIFGTMFVLGIIMGHPIYGFAGGAIAVSGFGRYRNSKADGFLMHCMYWYGLVPLRNRSVINAFQRRIYPA